VVFEQFHEKPGTAVVPGRSKTKSRYSQKVSIMNGVNHSARPVSADVARSPSLFLQVIGGLLIVGAMFTIAAGFSNWASEQPVQASQESFDGFFPF